MSAPLMTQTARSFILLTGTHDLCEKMSHRLHNSSWGRYIDVGMEPLLTVQHFNAQDIEPKVGAIKPTCLVVTSAQVLRYLASSSIDRSLPVWTIGESTAEALQRIGFQKIFTSEGGAKDLFANLAKALIPGQTQGHHLVLYLSGEDIAFDMPKALRDLGISVHHVVTYTTQASTSLRAATLQRLQRSIQEEQDIWLLLFSPKAASAFKSMCDTHGYTSLLPSIHCMAFSQDILDEVTDLPFKSQTFSEQPRLQSLLDVLEQRLNPGMPPAERNLSSAIFRKEDDPKGDEEC